MTSIIVERIMHDGKRAYKIIDFVDFLRYVDLPSEHKLGCPAMFRSPSPRKFIRVHATNPSVSGNYYVGQILTPQTFDMLVEAMKASGARLAGIKERIRQDAKNAKDWVGKIVEVEI